MVFENPVIREIVERTRVVWALTHSLALMEWDSETYMPREGVMDHAIAKAELSVLLQQILLKPELSGLVEKAEKLEGLNDHEKGVIRVLGRAIKVARALPTWLVAQLAKTTHEATLA